MRKVLFLLILSALVAGYSIAQSGKIVKEGVMTLSFGKVKGIDGTYNNVKGIQFPYRVERIQASPIDNLNLIKSLLQANSRQSSQKSGNLRNPNPSLANVTCYLADTNNDDYGIIGDGFDDPSSLDDLEISGSGVNSPWRELTMGMDIQYDEPYLIRWIVYDDYNAGFPSGVSAFNGVDADFGGIFDPTGLAPGTYKVTFNISPAAVTVDDTTVYLAQQFRDTSDLVNGNGAFLWQIRNVYNSAAAPTIGSSDDQYFWYDADPEPNGMYEDPEIETLGQGFFSNFLLGIVVGGTIDLVNPFTLTVVDGVNPVGNFLDLWQSDNFYFTVKPNWLIAKNTPNVVLLMEGQAGGFNVNGIIFKIEGAVSGGGFSMKVDFYDWTTGLYDNKGTVNLATTDSTHQFSASLLPNRYVNQTNRLMRARVRLFADPNSGRSLLARFDRAYWNVVRP